MGRVDLYANYWSGDFYIGNFEDKEKAFEYFENNKGNFRDYRGRKYGFPYATPYVVPCAKCD